MEVIHDADEKKFYIQKDKIIAEMFYIKSGKKIIIEHTWVDDDHRSEGLGRVLMDEMTEFARKEGIKVTAHCPYAKKMFMNHPDLYGDVLAS